MALGFLFGILGIYIASETVYRYATMVRGYLGVVMLYLLLGRYVFHPIPKEAEVEPAPSLAADARLVLFAFWQSLTIYWAGMQVADAVRILLKVL